MKNLFEKTFIFVSSLLSMSCAWATDYSMWANQGYTQEKIYIHTDNNSYFAGDTIWYKAYLLRADNLRPSNLSKIMYVELLSPDGYVVERQRLLVDHDRQSCGQFCLSDTMYSGFYEMRAYTRWQMNFNVSERKHRNLDDQWFYNKQLANDYFRDFEGLYSRVLPIYEKPLATGNFADQRIIDRPKRRQSAAQKGIEVQFYPEGGQLVTGIRSKVAFEVLDAQGRPLDIEGTLSDGTTLKTVMDGRGTFFVQPTGKAETATFSYQGKNYSFDLPKAEPLGAVISFDASTHQATFAAKNCQIGAVVVTCRGQLVKVEESPASDFKLDVSTCPTGVNEITLYDADNHPLAARQIFVNHHDLDHRLNLDILSRGNKVETQGDYLAEPFEQVALHSQWTQNTLRTVSVAVHDQRGDEVSCADGNIMTELLLAGDLKGFVAHPGYYFESDDQTHRDHLDLLLMVQGWRKYAPVSQFRYMPEQRFAIEGEAFKLNSTDQHEFDLLGFLSQDGELSSNPCFIMDNTGYIQTLTESMVALPEAKGLVVEDEEAIQESAATQDESEGPRDGQFEQDQMQKDLRNHKKKANRTALVEAELSKDNDVAGAVTETDSTGRFAIILPPFYDKAYLFMTAYSRKDSVDKCMTSKTDRDKMNPLVSPDYFVHREMFYPRFSTPYTWLQTHTHADEDALFDTVAVAAHLSDHVLNNVEVQAKRRRVLHHFDRNHPAFEISFSDLLNETIDYGLHYGAFNAITFWEEAARLLFGNMNSGHYTPGIRASVDGHTFLKKYKIPTGESVGIPMTPSVLNKRLDPRHIWKVRVFTDFDMRNGVGQEENRSVPDVWFEVIPVPNDGRLSVRRDRRILFDGFAYPVQFYHRDYSNSAPTDSADYRRTLYWNPNAHPDAEGRLSVSFYNGSRPSYLKISLCGVSADGKIYYY